jgi:hypothetical protein
VKCSSLDKERAHRASARVKTRLDHRSGRAGLRVGLRLDVHIGDEQDRLEQLVKADSLLGRNFDELVTPTPLAWDDLVVCQLLTDPIGVRVLSIDLVDGDHERDRGGLRVVDGLDGLRHHAVVGGHNDDGHVSDLRAAGAHGGERLVTWCVEEGQLA